MSRDAIDSFLRILAQAASRSYYREISVIGEERIPESGPVIFVGNHGNGLIDPALALGFLPATVRFVAKAPLWRHPLVGPFVRLAGAIPIQRRDDPGSEMERNAEAFLVARRHLQDGGLLCIFPEGLSHPEPNLQRMKTGTARIALDTVAGMPASELSIVPFGLSFSARDRFRSRVGIVIGDPIQVVLKDHQPSWGEVEALTREIERGLTAVTLNYESWREFRLVRRAVDLFLRRPGAEARPLVDRLNTHRRFLDAYRSLRREHPQPTAETAAAVLEYDRTLELVGLTDRQVLDPPSASRVISLTLRSLVYVLLVLPLAAVGFVLHLAPYLVGRYLPRLTRQPLHQRASWSVMSGVFLVPAIWIGLTVLAVRRWGWWASPILAVGPLSGWAALRVAETLHRLLHTARGMVAVHLGRRTHAMLLERRDRAQQALAHLADLYLDE